MNNVKASTLVIAAVTMCFFVGTYAFLVATGHDTTGVTTLLAGLLIPTALQIINMVKSDSVKETVDSVHSNTNGTLSALIESNKVLADKVAALSLATPVPDPILAIPVTPNPEEVK